MVVLPKIPLYIGWLVCVLVIPVGHENEKGLAPDNGGLMGCLFWAYSGVIGQGRDCRYSGRKLVQGQKRVVLGDVIAAAHLWADEGHAVPHIEYIVGNQRVRVLRGADGAA